MERLGDKARQAASVAILGASLHGAADAQASQNIDKDSLQTRPGESTNVITQSPSTKENDYVFKDWDKGTKKETPRQQSTEIIGVPYATLTENEKTNLQNTFSTQETAYAGIFQNPQINSSGRFQDLPFEQGSQADNITQNLVPLTQELQTKGANPELVTVINTESGTIAAVDRITNTTTDNSFDAGTYFYIDQNGAHYLELTQRPGGENDQIALIEVTPELRATLIQYQVNGISVTIAPDAKYVLGQFGADGTIVSLISQDRAIFFVSTTSNPTAMATPTPGQNPEALKTQVPQDVLASYHESVSAEQLILANATFPEGARMSSDSLEVQISQQVLDAVGVSQVTLDQDHLEQAHQLMINDAYSIAEVQVGEPIIIKGYKEGNIESGNTIQGVINKISNYVVTTGEYDQIKNNLDSNKKGYAETFFKTDPKTIMFFNESGTLVVISRGDTLKGDVALVLTLECFATPYFFLIENTAYGHQTILNKKLTADPMYFLLGVSQDGKYNFNNVYISFQ